MIMSGVIKSEGQSKGKQIENKDRMKAQASNPGSHNGGKSMPYKKSGNPHKMGY